MPTWWSRDKNPNSMVFRELLGWWAHLEGWKSESEVVQSCPTLRDPVDFLETTRLLRPRDFPGKSTGEGCHFLFQGIFPTQGLNLNLQHCRQMLYHLSHQESPSRRLGHLRSTRTETPMLRTLLDLILCISSADCSSVSFIISFIINW